MKKALLLTCAFALFVAFGFSQTGKYWSPNTESRESIVKHKAVSRLAFPTEFKLFNLNITPLKQQLMNVADNRVSHTTVISLPNADGQVEDFEVVEASNFDPALQARYPEIRAFSGRGITDRTATVKISICPAGIQTMVFRVNGQPTEFMEPYAENLSVYAVYKSQRKPGQLPWSCSVADNEMFNGINGKVANSNFTNSSAGELKTMRLAQSVTSEYSAYFGATSVAQIALVYGGINATLTRCNGVYEKDLAIHLNLIANNDAIIYFNAATDPYSPAGTGAGGAWNGELQNTLTSVIGEANYDIGHLFGASGGGGNAGCIGCVCVNGQKGSGFTSPADNIPAGDNFDIDYVAHEVGHQMGANHTFSFSSEGTGVNKEVGSGLTIMGYAGITNYDVAPHSIEIFHEASIAQIQTNMAGKTCPVTTNITANNATPTIANPTNYTIPKSTPFALTGSATDANAADVLTYCWEQDDNVGSGGTGAGSNATPTKTTGPVWTSWLPTTSPTRYCPKLTTILAGNFTTAQVGGDAGMNSEALSSVARTLHFRCTVRDNSPYSSTAPVKVGQTAVTPQMTVTVDGTTGPFKVTQPNVTGISWQAGTTQNITWDVAGTTGGSVNCANVKISLSTDGGFTWPIVLVANTANDGTEAVTIPNNVTTTARVVIESIGNIFFDISDNNFTITAPATGFSFNSVAPTLVPCGGAATANATLGTTASGGFNTPINLTASGNPAGTTVSFSSNPLTPGNSTTVTLTGVNTLAPGTYDITVQGTAGAAIQNSTVSFTVQPGTPPAITTQPAAAPSVCAGDVVNLTVATSASGATYQWQVNTGSGFTNIAGATNATYSFTPAQSDNNNQYHVIISTLCSSVTSNNSTLTVNTAANITQQPQSASHCVGETAVFSVTTATSTGVTYQWQVNDGSGFTDIAGATSATYTTSALTAGMNGNQYHVVITAAGSACAAPGTSNDVTLTVKPLPSLTATATDANVCSGGSTTLDVSSDLTGTTYSWTASSAFGTLTGANTATPSVTQTVDPAAPTAPLTITYTVTGTADGCSSTETTTVTSNPLPSVTLTADPSNTTITVPSTIVTLTANVTPSGSNYTYNWTQNGVAIANNSSTLQVDLAHVGEYDVTVSVNGNCASTSGKINIVDSVADKFYIYPNPNDGQFVIQLRNPNLVGNVTVFDSKGARVYAQINSVVRVPYQVISVDMKNVSSGVYILAIYDKGGERLATERIIVRR